MKFFSKQEAFGVLTILAVILLVSSYNFQVSLRRARDAQRKDDLGSISNALARYNDDFGVFPLASSDGKIMACKHPKDTPTKDSKGNVIVNWVPCEWGKDGLKDVVDPNFPPYLSVLPLDPQSTYSAHYVYFSDGTRFQIYASLEGKNEAEYDQKIVARRIFCGIRICNFGRASGQTPLDKSIEEYENEINEKK